LRQWLLVGQARHLLEGTGVKVAVRRRLPARAMSSDVKRFETEAAIDDGAHEIDVVLNLGRLKAGDDNMYCANCVTWWKQRTNGR